MVLEAMEVDIASLRLAVEHAVGETRRDASAAVVYDNQVLDVLRIAEVEATASDDQLVSTVDLMLALMDEGSGAAHRLLAEAGIELTVARSNTLRVLNQYSGVATYVEGGLEDQDDPVLALARSELSATRSAKRQAIEAGDSDEAFRLRLREKEILHEMARRRRERD